MWYRGSCGSDAEYSCLIQNVIPLCDLHIYRAKAVSIFGTEKGSLWPGDKTDFYFKFKGNADAELNSGAFPSTRICFLLTLHIKLIWLSVHIFQRAVLLSASILISWIMLK